MFNNISWTQAAVISDLLANRPLVYAPGSTYYYLNFGYCVLGRVIEKVTGTTYAACVQANVLGPCGISDMKIGGSTLGDRYPDEVRYYQSEFSPYSMNVTRMDSHGGWIASSTDLARFMVGIDRINSVPDLVSTTLLNQLYFGYTTWVHTGSLPGTSAILSRCNDTFSFALLANTRTESDPDLILDDLCDTVKQKIYAIGEWPSEDLF